MAHVCRYLLGATFVFLLLGCATTSLDDRAACVDMVTGGLRPIATERAKRFLGKVQDATAQCRGGERAVGARDARGWTGATTGRRATRRATSPGWCARLGHLRPQRPRDRRRAPRPRVPAHRADQVQPVRQQRHLSATTSRARTASTGRALKVWQRDAPAAGAPAATPPSAAPASSAARATLIRFRTLTGICNDIRTR